MKKIAAVFFVAVLAACATPEPPQFKTGKEVQPPKGCVEGRERGVKC